MSRRIVSVGSIAIAVVALVVVLVNATLVDRRGPAVGQVSLSAPIEGQPALAQTLTAIDIQFSEPVRTATVERRFRIEPYVAGSLSWDGSTATFTPSEKLPADTEFTVTVEPGFEDLAGNAATAGLDGWTFRTVGPPAVVEVDPADDADGVAVDGMLSLTFDRLMDTASVERSVTVEPGAAVRPSWSGPTLTLAFDASLLFGTTYTVTIGTGAADTDGSRLRRPFSTTFTTVEAALGVTRTVPADTVAGVDVRTPIAVLFDAPIDPELVEGSLSVTPPIEGGLRVVAVPSDERPRAEDEPEPPPTVLLFEPAAPLAAHTTYTVTLDSTVSRAGAPDQVAIGRSWTFTTGQPTTSAYNHIAYLSSRAGLADVWLMNPDGSAPRQLTSGLAPVSGFDVASDGSRVAWSAGGVVRIAAIDGTDARVLTSGGRFEYAPRFTPDGLRLLVARREADGTDAGWLLLPLEGGAGGERQLLATGAPPLGSTDLEAGRLEATPGLPVWASRSGFDPSGRWAAITTGSGELFVVDVEAEDPAAAPPMPAELSLSSAAVWSPASGRFLVVGREPGTSVDALFAVGVDGSAERVRAASGSVATNDDGDVAILVPDGAGVTHVAVAGGEGRGQPRTLTGGDDRSDRWPSFSPDGRSVLFGRVRADDVTTSAGIWTIDVTSAVAVPLTTEGAYPRWLP